MATNIFVNLPVRNLDASKAFFGALGFTFNAQFTDETAAAMVIDENIFSMLLTHEKFAQFTSKTIADAHTSSEVLIALSRDSKEAVIALFDKAIAAGATEARPGDDYRFMMSRAFSDLDGHIWEIMWMDPSFVQPS
ncbi:MAG: glyoxalase-like domain protein [Devosia sp.]|uniref:VOC family protein n=1 Tax=Devosia sp. TaxID=1871048 RepID=UPI0026176AF6|nr:VOC family protein [Devosia sp.]MDB5530784.1 glyoxalase-like domain protein [Devosia sp.]